MILYSLMKLRIVWYKEIIEIILNYDLNEQKGMTFDHNFGYSFPKGKRKG